MIFLIFALFGSLHFLIQTWTFFWCCFPFLLKSFLGISLGQFFWQRVFWLFTYRKLWFWILLLFCCCFGCIGSQLRHAGSLLHHAGFFIAVLGLSSHDMQTQLLCGTLGFQFPVRDRTRVPDIERWILNHWTTREVSEISNIIIIFARFAVLLLSLQSCPTLQPHGLQPASSSVHGILQVRTLEWVATPVSRGSSQTRDQN